jgi:CRP/FNR family transcriptional regulator, cyclic AMP receptor protein
LLEALAGQSIVRGNSVLANALGDVAVVEEAEPGQVLLRQGDSDNDLLLILVGRVAVLVNQRQVAMRVSGQHVGEMGAIDPTARRSATVIAVENTVFARIREPDLARIAAAHPSIWRAMAVELSHRLAERSRFHRLPNAVPVLFVGSSKETLSIAEALAASIPLDVAEVHLWTRGVFGASRFPIEDLAAQVAIADFGVLVAGPDDRVRSRGVEHDAPRDNVLFELGLFMGVLSRERTYLLTQQGIDLKIPTDLLGLTTIRYNASESNSSVEVVQASEALVQAIRQMGVR